MPKQFGGLVKLEPFELKKETGVSVDDFFGQKETANVKNIPLTDLIPFRRQHPFKPYSEDAMESLVKDIRENGLQQPIVVRKVDDGGFDDKFEILAGHNRAEAIQRLGLDSILCKVVDVGDNKAMLIVVGTNLEQRQLLPSEKAFALKIRMENEKNSNKLPVLFQNDAELFGEDDSCRICTNESKRNIYNYIRLTNLITPLLDMVDSGVIPMTAGVDISFLHTAEQDILYDILSHLPAPKITIEMSAKLKSLSQDAGLDFDTIEDILMGRHGREKKGEQPIVYSVKVTKDFGKLLKRVTKKRPLTEKESEALLDVIKKATDEFIQNLGD